MRLDELKYVEDGHFARAQVGRIWVGRALDDTAMSALGGSYKKGQYYVADTENDEWHRFLDPLTAQCVLLELLRKVNGASRED